MIRWLKKILHPVISKTPADGYDLWAADYDNQPDNLILRLDEEIFFSFLQDVPLSGKSVADIGCGTGRHWSKVLMLHPRRMAGFDVSEKMLEELQAKWPGAETYLLHNSQLSSIAYGQFDVIISTLAVAHIPGFEKKIGEWNKLLKAGGDIIITDYHPDALRRNAKRTFIHRGKTFSVKSFVYPVSKIRSAAKQLGWIELRFTERVIDEQVKSFYAKQNAEGLYQKYYGMPLIYGIHLRKSNDTP